MPFMSLSSPEKRYRYAKTAIEHKKHVLCETPVAMSMAEAAELYDIAREHHVILAEALKNGLFACFPAHGVAA